MMKNKTKILIAAIILMVAYGLLIDVNKPFIGMHDWNGAFYGMIVRNYNKLGLIKTKLGQVTEFSSETSLGYFNHYTPFLPLLFYSSVKILGFFESSFRLVTIFFSLLFLFYIFRIGNLINRKIGLLSALFVSLTPMFLYYGKLPDHDPVVMSLVTICVFYFLNYLKHDTRINFCKFSLCYVFALIESWPAFFLTPGFCLAILILKKPKKMLGFFIIFPTIIFTLFLTYTFYLNGSLADLGKVFKFRANMTGNQAYAFTLPQYISALSRFFVVYYTIILFILVAAGMFFLIIMKRNSAKKKIAIAIFLTFFIYGAAYPVLFQNLCWIHDYKIIHFMPLIAFSAGLGGYSIVKTMEKRLGNISLLLLLPLCFLIFHERQAYLKTIIITGHASQAHEIGVYLKNNMNENQTAIIFPKIFGTAHSTFVSFYSNGRSVSYEEKFENSNLDKYNYIILADNFNNENNRRFLSKKYKLQKLATYAIFKNNNSY